MEEKTAIMVRTLLATFCPKEENVLLRSSPSSYAKAISTLDIAEATPYAAFSSPLDLLLSLHPSWVAPLLDSKPKLLQKLYRDNYSLRGQKTFIMGYFSQIAEPLIAELIPKNLPPRQYLPYSELNSLSFFSRDKLLALIDLLGICDLAAELHHIVDRKIIEKAYTALSALNQSYLKQRYSMRQNPLPARLRLENWNLDKEELYKILHQRGILRFAAALEEEQPALIWYIAHHLDKARGEFILSNIQSAAKSLAPMQKKTLLHALNFLLTKEQQCE
jgi:hypothetical protein